MQGVLEIALARVTGERVRAVGSGRTVRTSFRLITATHQDLTAKVRAGEFRHDLYGKDGVYAHVAEAGPAPAAQRGDAWHTRVFDLSP